MRNPTNDELEAWQRIPYVKRGRDASGADCYGIVRLVREALRGDVLPRCEAISCDDRSEVPALLDDFLSGAFLVVEPMTGALAFVFDGRGQCHHCGIVMMIEDRVCVLESQFKVGVRWMPRRHFERQYGDVRYYDR